MIRETVFDNEILFFQTQSIYEQLVEVEGDRGNCEIISQLKLPENCEIISQLKLRLRQGSAGQAERNNFAGKQVTIIVI